MALVRGDRSRLAWKTELTYGQENGAGTWRRFGITHTAVCPDPEYDYNPQWIHGEGKEWKFMPGDAREIYVGSIPEIWLQDGRPLKFLGSGWSTGDYMGVKIHYIEVLNSELTSFTWEVSETDDSIVPNVISVRRYYGCKINRATLSARSGEQLVFSMDEIMCQNMSHDSSGVSYKYDAAISQNTVNLSSEQLYYFHEGLLNLWGTNFATVLDFRLEISHNLEPRYYIQRSQGVPVPHIIPDGRVQYRFIATIEIQDAEIFEALVTKGEYSSEYRGFHGVFTFYKGQEVTDSITIHLGPQSPSVTDPGCFIRRASSKAVDTPLIPIEVEIEVPNIYVIVVDSLSAGDWA